VWRFLVVLALFGVAFYFFLRRATTLFLLEVKDGKARFVRGRMPPGLLAELRDVLAGTRVQGVVSAVLDDREARVVVRGAFDAGTVQQLRNVVGRYPLAKIRSGAPP
jgi:hypothetical protein